MHAVKACKKWQKHSTVCSLVKVQCQPDQWGSVGWASPCRAGVTPVTGTHAWVAGLVPRSGRM